MADKAKPSRKKQPVKDAPEPTVEERVAALEKTVEKLWLHVDHFLPTEGPELPDHLKD